MPIYYVSGIPYFSDELYHHGIKGQKWGIRRFQNPDGTLTPAGKDRYGSSKEQKKFSELVTRNGIAKTEDAYMKANVKEQRSPQFQDAVANLEVQAMRAVAYEREANDASEKLRSKIYDDPNIYEEYLDMAVDARMKDMDPDTDLWTKAEVKSWYKYDDGDQGEYGVFETYVSKNPKDELVKTYKQKTSDSVRANTELLKASKRYANILLGGYGDNYVENLYPWQTYKHKANDVLSYRLSGAAKDRMKSYS